MHTYCTAPHMPHCWSHGWLPGATDETLDTRDWERRHDRRSTAGAESGVQPLRIGAAVSSHQTSHGNRPSIFTASRLKPPPPWANGCTRRSRHSLRPSSAHFSRSFCASVVDSLRTCPILYTHTTSLAYDTDQGKANRNSKLAFPFTIIHAKNIKSRDDPNLSHTYDTELS